MSRKAFGRHYYLQDSQQVSHLSILSHPSCLLLVSPLKASPNRKVDFILLP